MSGNSSTTGKITIICFFVIFCGTAFGMGFSVLEFAASSSFGPPIFMSFIPFGMGIFGILFCINIFKQANARAALKPDISTDGSESTVYTGDYIIRPNTPGKQKSIYGAPPICPSCGADINTETVDWVGPLQAKCPYCGATVEAVEKTF